MGRDRITRACGVVVVMFVVVSLIRGVLWVQFCDGAILFFCYSHDISEMPLTTNVICKN